MATSPRVSSEGVVLGYGARYSWAYIVVIATAIILLLIDIISDLGDWANLAVIALIAVAVILRPGGVRGPKHAVRAERESAEQRHPDDA
jgi:nicotinamide riboside transporter PnuC